MSGTDLDRGAAVSEPMPNRAAPTELGGPRNGVSISMALPNGAFRVSEVLSGRRKLSLRMIRALVAGLGIPAEVLLSI